MIAEHLRPAAASEPDGRDRHRTRTLLLGALGGLAVLAVLWYLLTTPSSVFVLLPDRAHPASAVVHVQGETPERPGTGIYYLDVLLHQASLAESWIARFEPDATVLPAAAVVPPGGGVRDQERVAQVDVLSSKSIAAAVALRALGRNVRVRDVGVVAEAVDPHAPSSRAGLQPGMVITAVDATRTPTLAALRASLSRFRPGQRVVLAVRDGTRSRRIATALTSVPGAPRHAVIGIAAGDAPPHVSLPVRVSIDTGDLGGPSAGLAFALEIYDALDRRSLSHGRRIAVTGTLALDGSVGVVGGVRQKTIAARRIKAALMLVPRGELREARRYAGSMRVEGVNTFAQALRALRG